MKKLNDLDPPPSDSTEKLNNFFFVCLLVENSLNTHREKRTTKKKTFKNILKLETVFNLFNFNFFFWKKSTLRSITRWLSHQIGSITSNI